MFRVRPGPVILCADDYGIAAGVSRGILELAQLGRISALSAITTLPRWEADAKQLRDVRSKVSIGLHINLTLGKPLGPMARLAPDGKLPTAGKLISRIIRRDVDASEIAAEVMRQLAAFERATGFLPDHVDGHQHMHAMPIVRRGMLDALDAIFVKIPKPLVRDPGDRLFAISGRGGEMAKAFGVGALSYGIAYLARRRGYPVNRGFSGFSAFDTERIYDVELASAMRMTGAGHILMCHPGYPDDELAALDPVTIRRGQELETLRTNPEMPHRIWKAEHVRDPSSGKIDWMPLVGQR